MKQKDGTPDVVIIGAGYAGMMAAMRLAGRTRRKPVRITLINPTDQFVERPKLHEVATGSQPLTLPLAHMLRGTRVDLRLGWVTAIEPDDNTVVVNGDRGPKRLRYDYTIYALGSRTDRSAVAGIDEYAYTLDPSGPRTTTELLERLQALHAGHVVVAGSGPTGVEVAAEIAELYPQLHVRIVTGGEFATFTDAGVRAHMRRAMDRLGVDVVDQAPIASVESDRVVLQSGESVPADVTIWAGGFRALPLAQESGLRTNERGQVLVDPALRSFSHPNVFAVGDAALPLHDTGAPPRMSLFYALVTGAHAAESLNRILRGKEPKPLGFSTFGQGIALGRHDAVGFLTFPNDVRSGPMITGRAGIGIRRFFVDLLRRMIEWERVVPGVFYWFGSGRGKMSGRMALSGMEMEQAS